jgi:DNA replication protein DnaC
MIEQTKQILSELYCHGILESLDLRLTEATTHGWSHTDFLSALVTDEKLHRECRQTTRRLRAAEFRIDAIAERWDYQHKRSITRTQVQELLELGFLKNSRNLILIGETGVGKSFLAQALGNKACRNKYTVKFIGMNLFIEKASLARSDGSYLKFRDKMIKPDLLILDDIGISRLPQETIQDLYDILEERFHSKSTLITTQLPLENWKEVIEDTVALEAILDRLAQGAIIIKMIGKTYRDKAKEAVQNLPINKL